MALSVRGMNSIKVFVVGVGMTKFEKPGRRVDFDYPDMVKESVTKALNDASINYSQIQQSCVGYAYGDPTCGQRALYPLGMTGIPIYNVSNACATGSTALFLAKQLIEGGLADCVLAVGFEKMQSGSLTSQYTDRTNPMDRHMETMMKVYDLEATPFAAQMFGNAGREHMKKYGTKPLHFAKIAYKNHKHSVNNPYAQFQKEYSLNEILESPEVHSPLTKLQCCPTSDGSAACVLASEKFVREHGLENRAVEIVGMEMGTDLPSTFKEESCMKVVGWDMTKLAADKLYSKTGLRPSDVDVVELHDCFSCNELITYEALGLCAPGAGAQMVDSGDNTYGGKVVVNPSGGLISKGHPLGATGLAQCSELVWQLRGEADKRQVPNARLALQHNIGLGGAAVVALYRKMVAGNQNKTSEGDGVEESKFISYPAFQEIKKAFAEDGSNIVKKVKGVICFKVTNGPAGTEGVWYVDAKNGTGSVQFGGTEKADVTITVADEDLLKMMTGQLDTVKAFFQKKLKVSGNMGLAMKVKEFSKPVPKAKL